jgi:peroxin-5
MEAAVQRDPTDARAWFELGVKQQEREREQQAISALRRALELDPTHLPSWLALAISYTNEGDRYGTYQTILNWVRHNEKYHDIVATFEESNDRSTDSTQEFEKLIGCLIAMARGVSRSGSSSAEVDADVQIALAVLLNTNEVHVFGLTSVKSGC